MTRLNLQTTRGLSTFYAFTSDKVRLAVMQRLTDILTIGHSPSDTPREKTLKSAFAVVLGVLFVYALSLALLPDRSRLEIIGDCFGAAIATLALVVMGRSKSLNLAFAFAMAFCLPLLTFFYFIHGNRDGDIYFYLLIPIAAVAFLGPRRSRLYFALSMGFAIATLLIDPMLPKIKHDWHLSPLNGQAWLFHSQDKYLLRDIEAVTFFSVTTLVYFLLYSAASALGSANRRVEALLLNVLPRSIADRLMAADLRGRSASIVESYDDVTILFADIVGFTKLTQTTPPGELISFLNHLFSAFDQLAEEHGVEKIKTIGDAYMAVCGLPDPDDRHAEKIADLALDMLATTERFGADWGRPVEIRIGINSGPVIAGVIGRRKFIYDLWGDAVNMASRMESHSTPGVIQTSANTCEALKDKFRFASIGTVELKGHGSLETWQLLGRR